MSVATYIVPHPITMNHNNILKQLLCNSEYLEFMEAVQTFKLTPKCYLLHKIVLRLPAGPTSVS